jgi:hypothetical protein
MLDQEAGKKVMMVAQSQKLWQQNLRIIFRVQVFCAEGVVDLLQECKKSTNEKMDARSRIMSREMSLTCLCGRNRLFCRLYPYSHGILCHHLYQFHLKLVELPSSWSISFLRIGLSGLLAPFNVNLRSCDVGSLQL